MSLFRGRRRLGCGEGRPFQIREAISHGLQKLYIHTVASSGFKNLKFVMSG